MDWIAGIQQALEYIERHLTEEVDYDDVARVAFSSRYHFQRVFSILCGYTLGEYIRNRRLTLAGEELAAQKIRVIDAAVKYGYDSPDSFAKAFQKFHGIYPSQARLPGARLRSFTPLSVKLSLEGGCMLNYRIEEKPRTILLGYTRHFEGAPGERFEQEEALFIHTRANQYLLMGLAEDPLTNYGVIHHVSDDGYDFSIATRIPDVLRSRIREDCVLREEEADRFHEIKIPAHSYAVFETERAQYPTLCHMDLRKKAVSEWLPTSPYFLADAPEVSVYHWYRKPQQGERYIEIWLPIERRPQ